MTSTTAAAVRTSSAPASGAVATVSVWDAEAFERFYRAHYPALAAYARARFLDSEDLVSRVFLRTYCALRNGHGPAKDSGRAYLYTAVTNAARDDMRARARTQPADDLDELATDLSEAPDERAEARIEQLRVAVTYRHLPERWRAVLRHTVLDGRPATEFAAATGASGNCVHALARRARDGLRARYRQNTATPAALAHHLRTCTTCASAP